MNYKLFKKIDFARYGCLKKYINVTHLLNKSGTYQINCELFNYLDYPNRVKTLIIIINNKKYTLKDGDSITLNLNDIKLTNEIQLTNNQNKVNYILSTNVRDEKNIIEWIIYHLLIGFDRILIIDHKSKTPIKNLVNNYNFRNKVDVIESNKDGAVKIYFLNNIVIPYMKKNCNKYFIHLDGDEYLNLNSKYKNIDNFVNSFDSKNSIAINWLMFGSNNLEENNTNFILDKYIKCSKNIHNNFKGLINVNHINNNNYINPHYIGNLNYTNVFNKTVYVNKNDIPIDKFNELYDKDKKIAEYKAVINHYYVQSRQDLLDRKINRNRDDINQPRQYNIEKMLNISNDIIYDNLYREYFDKITNIYYNDKSKFVFIILRYVNNENTNVYWQECYDSIRKFYDNKIIIIDDHSDKKYLTVDKDLINTEIIYSEYQKGCGELLPYVYMITHNLGNKCIVLHDSMTLKKHYNFDSVNGYKKFTRLLHFPNNCYKIDIEHFQEMSTYIKNGDKILKYHKDNFNKLLGTFGVCYMIDYDYLIEINNKYNIINLVNYINTRRKRQCLERFLSCLFEYDKVNNYKTITSLFGNLFNNLAEQKKNNNNVVLFKKFTGR